jgi:WD40 repeat protein
MIQQRANRSQVRFPSWLAAQCVVLCLAAMASPAVAVEPPVTALAFSPDGNSVLAAGQGSVAVHRWPQLKRLSQFSVEMQKVHDLAFSPNGNLLLVVGGDPGESGSVELWDWNERKRVKQFQVSEDVAYAAAWKHDSTEFICGRSDHQLTVVRLGDGKRIDVAGHSKSVFAVGSLPDESGWISAGADRSVRWWKGIGESDENESPRQTLNNHTGEVVDIAIRPGEARFPMAATAGKDLTVRLWQPTIGRLVRFARLSSRPLAIRWTPDGSRLGAACVDGHVRVIDPETVEILQDQPAVASWAYSLAAAPDGKSFAVGGPRGELKKIDIR